MVSIEITIKLYINNPNQNKSIYFIATIINWILTLFPLILSCFIHYKLHKKWFKDIYKISNEVKYQIIIILTILILNTMIIFIYLYYESNTNNNLYYKHENNLNRLNSLCNLILIYILLFGIAIFTTAYPVILWL